MVRVVIPTRNSARTIESSIKSIQWQPFSDIEIIIIDTKSSDDTIKISQRMDCNIISTDSKILGTRYEGFRASSGENI